LLESLLETSEGQEQDLVDRVNAETQAALESAEVLLNAGSAVEDAQAALALREQEHQAASEAHDDQEDKKTAAEQEFADLSVGLDNEQEVIREVIAMLQGLQPQQPCDGCVELDGRFFATMDFCPPETPYNDPACDTCQREYLPLPDGWQIASGADTETIAASHIFNTHVIVGADGNGWKVLTYGSGMWSSNVLQQDGDTYKPSNCALKILMVRG